MPTQQLRVGLVGYGFAGQTFHAPVVSEVPGLVLAAVASSKPEKVLADWPGVAVFPDVHSLLAAQPTVDLVVVATPNEAHFPMAKSALEAGRHVVVDKPFTLNAGQARELADLARAKGRLVSVYQNRRFDSDFLTLKQLLADGRVGRPVFFESHFDRYRPDVRVRWREQQVPGAGLWVDLGSHLMDQAVQLFGKPNSVQLDTAVLRDGAVVEDYFHAVLRWDEGPHAPLRAVLHATALAADPAPRYILHGTRGSYVKYGVDPQEDALRTGARPGGEGWGADPDDGLLTLIGDTGQPEPSSVPTLAGDYTRYYAAVRDAIAGVGPNPVTPEQAVELMELLDLGSRSAAEGRALPT